MTQFYRVAWLLDFRTVGFAFYPTYGMAQENVEEFYKNPNKPDEKKFPFASGAKPHVVGDIGRAFHVDMVSLPSDSAIVKGGQEEWPMYVRAGDDPDLWAQARLAQKIGHAAIAYIKLEEEEIPPAPPNLVSGAELISRRARKIADARRPISPAPSADSRIPAPAQPQP